MRLKVAWGKTDVRRVVTCLKVELKMWNLDLAGNVSIDRTQNVNARREAYERFAGIISQLPIKHLSRLVEERSFC